MVDSPPYIKIALAPGLHSPKHLSPHTALDRGPRAGKWSASRHYKKLRLFSQYKPSCPAPYWVQGLPTGTSRRHVIQVNITLMACEHKSTNKMVG